MVRQVVVVCATLDSERVSVKGFVDAMSPSAHRRDSDAVLGRANTFRICKQVKIASNVDSQVPLEFVQLRLLKLSIDITYDNGMGDV